MVGANFAEGIKWRKWWQRNKLRGKGFAGTGGVGGVGGRGKSHF